MTSKIIHSQRLVLQNNIVLWKSSIFQYFLLIYRPSSWVCILLRGPRLIKQPPSYTGKLERLEYNFSLAWLITQEFNILTDEKFSHALRTYHILLKLLKGHDKKSQWHHKALIFQFKFSFNHFDSSSRSTWIKQNWLIIWNPEKILKYSRKVYQIGLGVVVERLITRKSDICMCSGTWAGDIGGLWFLFECLYFSLFTLLLLW